MVMVVVLDGGALLWWWRWLIVVVVLVVVDSGAWDQQPSLEGDPGGPRGAPRGGDPLQDHLQPDPTRPNKTLPADPVLPSHIYRRLL